MKEIVIATTNKGKLREIRSLFADLPLEIRCLADYPGAPEVVEDGKTFSANAAKKASTIARFTGTLSMGEDSGIEVFVLGNAPGIYSARFAGLDADDADNNAKLLRDLKGVPNERRGARYRCFAALAAPDGSIIDIVNGQCSGRITDAPRGNNGFGYDPYFLLTRYAKTFGELDPAIKAKISHRARAMRKMKILLDDYLSSACV